MTIKEPPNPGALVALIIDTLRHWVESASMDDIDGMHERCVRELVCGSLLTTIIITSADPKMHILKVMNKANLLPLDAVPTEIMLDELMWITAGGAIKALNLTERGNAAIAEAKSVIAQAVLARKEEWELDSEQLEGLDEAVLH